MPYQQQMNTATLPPDAAQMLAGGAPGLPMPPQQGGEMASESEMGGMGMSDPGMGAMGGDPMMAIKAQFEPMVDQLQLLAQSFPMATEELQAAGQAIARAMLKVAQGMQPSPMAPPVPA